VETLSVTVLSKFKSCYHKCIKKLFVFSDRDLTLGTLRLQVDWTLQDWTLTDWTLQDWTMADWTMTD